MKVEFGNDQAVEEYRDPTSDDPGLVRRRDYPGQNTTTFNIPAKQSGEKYYLRDAFNTVIGTMEKHYLKPGTVPKWVESDNAILEQMLKDHYEITKPRPKTWGKKKRGAKS